MKIYAIIHYFDNGLVYEDNENYVTTNLYSDLSKASEIYEEKTSGKYEGAFELVEWEIDTNIKKTLQETKYNPCTPFDPWDNDVCNVQYDEDDWDFGEWMQQNNITLQK